MPDVRMPDGTIIRNVPEGTTRAQLMARLAKAKPQPKMGRAKAAILGFGDSGAAGFMDELAAGLDTLRIDSPAWRGGGFRDTFNANLDRNRQELKKAQTDRPGAYLGGQIAGVLVPLPTSKAKAAATLARPATVGGQIARVGRQAAPDIARGAVYGAGSAEGGLAQRGRGAVGGAAQGAAGHAAGRVLGATASRLLKGKKIDPAVRELADAGVVMTPGQRAGPGSIKKGLEEGLLGSLPIVKAIPNAAKRRGIEQLNVAAINKALAPIGQKLPGGTKPGRELIQKTGDAVYSAYDASVDPLMLGNDSGLSGAVKSIAASAQAKVGQGAAQLQAIVDNTMSTLGQGQLKGPQVRDLMQDLRAQAADFAGSSVANERNIGKELWKLHDHLDAALVRQNKGGQVESFKKAREAVSNFKRIEAAAAKSPDGVFSPTQLHQAVTRRGFGTTTAKVARGEAPLQSLSDAAKQVLPDSLPNSGSPERLLATSMAGPGLSAGAPSIAAFLDPTAGAVTGAALGAYIPGVDRLLQNLAINRPDLLVRLGLATERATPALGTAGTMTALSVGGQ